MDLCKDWLSFFTHGEDGGNTGFGILGPGQNALKVGTDCSGMETPIIALQNLKVPFESEF